MNKQVKIDRLKGQHVAGLFKITSRCNDACPFCLEYEFIKSKRADLSLSEFKKNFDFLQANFNVDYSVLTGGEPTLHPEFFKMLLYMKEKGEPFRFITNLIKFNEPDFLKRVETIFNDFKNKKQKKLSKIIVSVNDLPEKNTLAAKRWSGLELVLSKNLPIMVTVMIYRQNLEDLPGLARLLKELFKKHQKLIHVEFRMIYIEGTLPRLLKNSLPLDFSLIAKKIEEAVVILNSPFSKVTLWNFPLCLLLDYSLASNEGIKERQNRRLIKINKDFQLNDFEVRDWENYLKANSVCQACKINNLCSGIDKKYIKEYNVKIVKK